MEEKEQETPGVQPYVIPKKEEEKEEKGDSEDLGSPPPIRKQVSDRTYAIKENEEILEEAAKIMNEVALPEQLVLAVLESDKLRRNIGNLKLPALVCQLSNKTHEAKLQQFPLNMIILHLLLGLDEFLFSLPQKNTIETRSKKQNLILILTYDFVSSLQEDNLPESFTLEKLDQYDTADGFSKRINDWFMTSNKDNVLILKYQHRAGVKFWSFESDP